MSEMWRRTTVSWRRMLPRRRFRLQAGISHHLLRRPSLDATAQGPLSSVSFANRTRHHCLAVGHAQVMLFENNFTVTAGLISEELVAATVRAYYHPPAIPSLVFISGF